MELQYCSTRPPHGVHSLGHTQSSVSTERNGDVVRRPECIPQSVRRRRGVNVVQSGPSGFTP
eukprot:4453108-Prymnesium_polylepis.1